MNYSEAYLELSPTTLAEVTTRDRILHYSIHQLWQGMPRIAGPAYPVRCGKGDNLMLHAAIYRAPPGSIIVCEAGDMDFAVAGGNVCAIAQKRGIAGFIIDGLVRDIAEIRASHFPVLARGLIPCPGTKDAIGVMNGPVNCGSVVVRPGDMIVADEEGIVCIPHDRIEEVLNLALAKAAKEVSLTVEMWEKTHREKVEQIMLAKGFANIDSIQ